MFDIENLYKCITSVGTLLAGIGAILAACTWTKQIKYKKRYEAAENLGKCFLDFLQVYRIYFYDVYRKSVNNKNAISAIDLEGEDYKEQFSLYVNSWLNMKYYLSKKEIEAFTYKPHEIHSRFIQLLSKRNGNSGSDGYDITYKFEEEIANIFENGLKQVKDLREKKLFNF